MNVNDCPYELAKNTFMDIKKNFDHISVLLHGYGGAGPFPQCFDNLNIDQKIKAAAKKPTCIWVKKASVNAVYIILFVPPTCFMISAKGLTRKS